MDLEALILQTVKGVVDEFGYTYFYLEEAIATAVADAIKDEVGATQEKLLNDLTMLRARLRGAERQNEALRDTLAELAEAGAFVVSEEGD